MNTFSGGLRSAALLGAAVCVFGACAPRAPGAGGTAASPAASDSALRARVADYWNSATVYFLLTDRFLDGDTANDHALGRARDGAVLRSFEGGDLRGVLRKIEDGYFDSLGVDAIWLTPFVEQIHGSVDEGTGKTYGYHGYWTLDWTAVDPALGTKEDLRALVEAAHRHHIRVLMDAVINHTGPATAVDPAWPADWVRTGPNCTYRDYASNVLCTLVATLPDVRTESDQPVGLPGWLVEKWRAEGRLDAERASLDSFFLRTGYPRAPRYYIIKWLTDWVRAFGFDGYRMDTAKHFGAAVADELRREADRAFADWKRAHPLAALDDLPFYVVGEVYGWAPEGGRGYSYGDSVVDFFAHGYDALINFGFKADARWPIDSLFTTYAALLHGPLRDEAILNYVSSHDDGGPYDRERRDPLGAGTRLLLAPGGAQIYYGDELARPLVVAGAAGDANLRSPMNWADLARGGATAEVLEHWRKLGRFRQAHPAVGAGVHRTLQASPLVFSRVLDAGRVHDRVVVALDQDSGAKAIPVLGTFRNGTTLVDGYSGEEARVRRGVVRLTTPYRLVLLGEPPEDVEANDTVVVYVTNNYEVPMDVYAVGAGTSYRMGVVNPGIVSRFILRAAMLATSGDVEFRAQASGYGLGTSSGPIRLHGGDVVDFVIATWLAGSRATIRR